MNRSLRRISGIMVAMLIFTMIPVTGLLPAGAVGDGFYAEAAAKGYVPVQLDPWGYEATESYGKYFKINEGALYCSDRADGEGVELGPLADGTTILTDGDRVIYFINGENNITGKNITTIRSVKVDGTEPKVLAKVKGYVTDILSYREKTGTITYLQAVSGGVTAKLYTYNTKTKKRVLKIKKVDLQETRILDKVLLYGGAGKLYSYNYATGKRMLLAKGKGWFSPWEHVAEIPVYVRTYVEEKMNNIVEAFYVYDEKTGKAEKTETVKYITETMDKGLSYYVTITARKGEIENQSYDAVLYSQDLPYDVKREKLLEMKDVLTSSFDVINGEKALVYSILENKNGKAYYVEYAYFLDRGVLDMMKAS